MISINLPVRSFTVPNFVIIEVPPGNRGDGIKEAPTFPLAAIDPQTLAAMCDAFRMEVFAKAGKVDPRMAETVRAGEIEMLLREVNHRLRPAADEAKRHGDYHAEIEEETATKLADRIDAALKGGGG